MAGTEQPVPIKIGMKDFPDKPNFLKTLSRIKAILDIYPMSSRIAMNKNKAAITGKKPRTAPTPPIIPSTKRDVKNSDVPAFSKKPLKFSPIISVKNFSFTQSVTGPPT